MARSSLVIPQNASSSYAKKEDNKLIIDKILLENNIINQEQLRMAKAHMRFSNKSLTDIIIALDMAEETDILSVIKNVTGFPGEVIKELPEIDVNKIHNFKENISSGVSEDKRQVVYNVDYINRIVYILTSDIYSVKNLNSTKNFFKSMNFECVFNATTDLNISILKRIIYKEVKNYEEELYNLIQDKANIGNNLTEIIKLIIENATIKMASDVFFMLNKDQDFSYIFFKINREKTFQFVIPTSEAEKINQFIKQKAKMEASKISGHQDGSLRVDVFNKYPISIRANSITTIMGEQLTLRLLMDGKTKLVDLGFEENDALLIQKVLSKLKGVVVIAGITGSGKTTTLHAMLNYFDRDKYNIITLEDPVEIRKNRINQIEINEDAGQSFSDGIRSILRQAPDIILVGEIRDLETAMRAVELAITGHLVLCTIHAPSVSMITTRLREIGLERTDAFENSVCLAIHQHLVKKNKEDEKLSLTYEISNNELEPLKNTRKNYVD